MKKIVAIVLCMLFCLTACQEKSRPLTEEEIQQVNDAFFFMVERENGPEMNPLCCFLLDHYDSPKEIPLGNFLLYFPSDADVTDEEEFEDLKALENFPFKDVPSLENMPVPIHRIPEDRVDAVLEYYAGITTADLSNKEGVIYLEAAGAYYTTTSDAGGGYFDCHSGELKGDTLILKGNGSSDAGSSALYTVLTMKKVGEQWKIVSLTNELA